MKKNFITVMAAVLLSGLTAYGVAKTVNTSSGIGTVVSGEDGMQYRTVNLAQTDYPDFTYAAESAVDAVVFVQVSGSQQVQYFNPFADFFPFFGDGGSAQPQTREKKFQGSGSGVIIREDGYIVTNNHVVANASEIKITLNNNKTYDAKLIGTDAATDVALIKVDATGLPFIPIADSDKLRLGEWVLAIGSPLGKELQSTITAGIVSAKGRSMPNTDGEFRIESFIQTDAAVNPGNSGGALVNALGELVGINTSIISLTGSYTGYSFAVPVNIVKKITDDFIQYGSVQRAMLGVSIAEITPDMAKELGVENAGGVYVAEVQKGGVADRAGIRKGDIITEINLNKVHAPAALQEQVNRLRPGEQAVVTVLRDGAQKEFIVTF